MILSGLNTIMIFFVYRPNNQLFRTIAVIALIMILFAQCLAMSALSSTTESLSSIENKLFEHDYPKEDDKTRLDRIEKFVFGTTSSDPVRQRLDSLLKVMPLSDEGQNPNQTKADTTLNAEKPSPANLPSSKPTTDTDSSTAPFDYSHYPRVTGLEQQLLGRSYADQNLTERLNRLDDKCFGKPSDNPDLGQRVENLEAYAQRHDIYGEYNPANNSTGHKSRLGLPDTETKSFQPVGGQQNIEGMVSIMENKVFGHSHPHRSLPKRLTKLEKRVYHYNSGENNQPILTRVSRLWSTLKSSADRTVWTKNSNHKTKHSKNFPEQPVDTNMVDQDNNSTLGAQSDQSENTNSYAPGKTHHSWLHKVGQVAGTVGGVTVKALSGTSSYSGYGMGGYGSPMW